MVFWESGIYKLKSSFGGYFAWVFKNRNNIIRIEITKQSIEKRSQLLTSYCQSSGGSSCKRKGLVKKQYF